MKDCAVSQMITSVTTETVVAYVTVCPVVEAGSGGETNTLAAPTSSNSHDENTSTTGTSVIFSTDIVTMTATYSTLHGGSIIEGIITYLTTTTIPVTKTLTVGTVVGTDSASDSSSAVGISQPAGSNDSVINETHPPAKISHGTAASSSAFSDSTHGVARSGSSTVISPSSSTSTAPTAVYTGAASQLNAWRELALWMMTLASYLVL